MSLDSNCHANPNHLFISKLISKHKDLSQSFGVKRLEFSWTTHEWIMKKSCNVSNVKEERTFNNCVIVSFSLKGTLLAQLSSTLPLRYLIIKVYAKKLMMQTRASQWTWTSFPLCSVHSVTKTGPRKSRKEKRQANVISPKVLLPWADSQIYFQSSINGYREAEAFKLI